MFQPAAAAKRCFTIESLVGKDNSHPLAEDSLRPVAAAAAAAALGYPASAAVEAFAHGFQGSAAAGRSLYGGPELLFPEAVSHPPALTVHPPQLGSSHLPPSPHPFFGPQPRDPLNFYPWVLRNRFFGHRFQGKQRAAASGEPRARGRGPSVPGLAPRSSAWRGRNRPAEARPGVRGGSKPYQVAAEPAALEGKRIAIRGRPDAGRSSRWPEAAPLPTRPGRRAGLWRRLGRVSDPIKAAAAFEVAWRSHLSLLRACGDRHGPRGPREGRRDPDPRQGAPGRQRWRP